jgi:DNA-binding transcriptional MerR regulator
VVAAPKTLLQHIDRQDLTIEELTALAARLLTEIAPRQTRYKVVERPDVRTIRYYVAQRLLPPAVSYAGGRARYSGTHLLRLLMIKKMQAEHQTLQQIARALERISDEQLLEALATASPPAAAVVARRASLRVVPSPRPRSWDAATVSRLVLLPGVTIDLPDSYLDDDARRRALADELETLAERLRHGRDPRKQGE